MRFLEGLCRTIENSSRGAHRYYLKDNARIQVLSFLLYNGPLLNILVEVNPTVEDICNRLRAYEKMKTYVPSRRSRGGRYKVRYDRRLKGHRHSERIVQAVLSLHHTTWTATSFSPQIYKRDFNEDTNAAYELLRKAY
ncbi:unnamed protein product [Rodentolepis nana]|uniref:DDE_Tnp_Tn3 domain-containing protein n=1 Tax=Rodentolepis nana TaxID=102285 RepID=A0A0R3U0Q9_RODNA|nr:unnamed protein product [Rodentolepis nana]